MLEKRLRELRQEKDLLQKDVATALNITTSAYGFYEQGKRTPDTNTIEKIAEFYNVSVDYLLGRSDVKNPYVKLDKISYALDDDKELAEFWNLLKEREDLKLLFKQTKDLAPKDIKQILRIIKAIEDEEDINDG